MRLGEVGKGGLGGEIFCRSDAGVAGKEDILKGS